MNNLIDLYKKYDLDPEDNQLIELLRDPEIRHFFVNAAITTVNSIANYSKRDETINQLRGMLASRDYDFTWTIAMYIQHIYFLALTKSSN